MTGKLFLFFSVFFVLLMSLSFGATLTDCNTTISASGTYYLQNDLNLDANYLTISLRGIDRNVCIYSPDFNNVEIDFNGFKIFHEGTLTDSNNIGVLFAGSGDYITDINVVDGTAIGISDLVDFNTGAADVIISDANTQGFIVGVTSCGLDISTVNRGIDDIGDQLYGQFFLANDLNVEEIDLTDDNACISLDSDYLWLACSRKAINGLNTRGKIGVYGGAPLYSNIVASCDFNNLYEAIRLDGTNEDYILMDNHFNDINSLYLVDDVNIIVTPDNLVDDKNIFWFNNYHYDVNLPQDGGGRIYYSDLNCPSSFDYNNAAAFMFYNCNYATTLDINGLAVDSNIITGAGALSPFSFVDSNNISVHDYEISLLPMDSIDAITERSFASTWDIVMDGDSACNTEFVVGGGNEYLEVYNIYGNYDNNQAFVYTGNIKYHDINLEGDVYFSAIPLKGYLLKDFTINGVGLWAFDGSISDYNCPTDLNSDYAGGGYYAFFNCATELDFNGLVLSPDFSNRFFSNAAQNYGIITSGTKPLNITNLNERFVNNGIYGGLINISDSNLSDTSSDANNIIVYSCNSDINIYDTNISALEYHFPLLIDANSAVDINSTNITTTNQSAITTGTYGATHCVSGEMANSDINGSEGANGLAMDINNSSNCPETLDINNNNFFGATIMFNYFGNFLDNNYDDSNSTPADFNDSIDANFYNNTFEIVDFYNAEGTVNFYDNIVTSNLTATSSINIVDSNLVATIYDNNIYNSFDCLTCTNMLISGDTNGQYSIYNNKFYVENDANYLDISVDSLDITLDLNTTLDCTGSRNIIQGTCVGGNYWTSGGYIGQSDICEDRAPYYGVCDTNYSPSGQSTFYDYHPLADMMFVDPGVSPSNVKYKDGSDSVEFNLATSFYDLYYNAGLEDYYKDGVNVDVNLSLYYVLVSSWDQFDYKLRKLITITNNDSVQKNSFTLDLNFEDYSGLDINPYQITFSSEIDHYTILNTDINALKVEVALDDFLATGADTDIYVYYDYKWYDKEDDVNVTYPNFYSWKSSELYTDFNGNFYGVEPANSTYSFGVGTNNLGSNSDIQIFLFNEEDDGRVSSSAIVEIDGNAVGYGGVYNSDDGNYLVYGKLDSNATAYLLDGNDLNTLITTYDFNYSGSVTEGIIGSDGNYYLLVGRDVNATVYKLSSDLETTYDSNFLNDITVEKDIIESDGNILVLGVTSSGDSLIYDLNLDLDVSSSLTISEVLMVEMEEDEDGNIILVGRDDGNYVILTKYDRDMSTLISDKNYSDYTVDNTDYIDLEIYDGNTYYNGSERDYNYILRFSNRDTIQNSWILYLDSDLNVIARSYYPDIVFTREATIANNKYYVGLSSVPYAEVYTIELYREDVNTAGAYNEPTLLTSGTIKDYCGTTNLAEQVGDDCNYLANFSGFTNDVNYVMMMYGESRTASQLFRKNMNYFFFSVPTINQGGGIPGGDDPDDGDPGADDDAPDDDAPDIEPIIPDENPAIFDPDGNESEPIIEFKPEIFFGESQGIGIFKDNVCVVGAKIKVISSSGKVEEYVMDEKCNLEFIPTEEGNYIMEITLPDGTKIIKQFKVKPKSKVGLFDDGVMIWVYIVLSIVVLGSIGYIVYKFFIKDRMRGLGDV